jgi:predicted lipoprotein
MNRAVVILGCALLIGGLLWFFPLFHIERLDSPTSVRGVPKSNPKEFAASFWAEKAVPSFEKVPDASHLIALLHNNRQTANQQFGRKVGVSRSTLFVMRGEGTVVEKDKKGVSVALESGTEGADIMLQTGLLFGNTVRDATGLLDASEFEDSQQFNEVSAELNRLIEESVISALKEKAVNGRRIEFVGCVEIHDNDEIAKPLSVIPMQVRIE